nr:hypothetical protein [Tanacetum cinerariifolium]
MSDSDESGVTYTDISSPFEELSDIGSPRADDHEHLMLPEMLEDSYAPSSPDYVPGPEHADDEIVAEDQPYAEDASPIAQSPEYVPESDFEAHPEDDDDEDPEEDPVDYPADEGDDGDDEEESSEDDEDDKDDDMDAPSAEETKPFKTDESAATPPPHPAYRMTARISIPDPTKRQLLAGWLNMLFRDRRAYAYTRHLMETKARMSREAWVRATDASDLVHGEDDEDDEDDDMDIKADGEEEEHPAPADSVV